MNVVLLQGTCSGNGKLEKKKRRKKSRLRLATEKLTDTILEDEELTRSDFCVQASLCHCDMSATAAMVEPKSRDACVQANLCQCSEYVDCAGDCGIIASQETSIDTTLESADATGNSHMPEIGNMVSVSSQASTDKIVLVSTASEMVVKSKSKKSAVVDVEGICSELEAFDLDDTVAYDYTCEKSLIVGCSVADQTDLQGGVDGSVSKMAEADTSEPDANQSDIVLVGTCDVSLQTSPVENVADTDVDADLSNTGTDDALPLSEDKVIKSSLRAASSTGSPLLLQPPDANGAGVVRSSGSLFSDSFRTDGDKLVDEVFESMYAAARAITDNSCLDVSDMRTRPDFDDASDNEIATHADGIEAGESCAEVFYHDGPTPPDDQSCARKVLTSTTIGSPVAVANFFGLALSSLSGSDQSPKYSVDGGRRKSKAGRGRVSMCGECESPVEYFTPHRTAAAASNEVTTVADTDEEDDSTVPNAYLYTTAIEEDLLNSISETDEDDDLEAIEPASDGCIPDSPTEGSEPFQSESLDKSVPHSRAERNVDYKELPAGPSRNSPRSAVAGRASRSPERVQTKAVVFAASERNEKDTSHELDDELLDGDLPFERGAKNCTAAEKNRFELNIY